jgi:lactate dehydrogenase-like 2-hydroxyacid dehydrogenase
VTADRPRVLVTRRLPGDVEERLAGRFDVEVNRSDIALSAEQLAHAMQRCDALLCTVSDRITAAHFAVRDRRVRVLANFGVGTNHIDLDAARAAGVIVTNTPDVLTDDTADLALLLIGMVMRRLGEGERHVRTGAWSGWRPTHLLGRSPRGKVLGIVGYGRIGRTLARRAVAAFDMDVQWWQPREPRVDDPATAGPPTARRAESLEVLLRTSDVVSLHAPATAETRHLLDAERLALLRPDAYLVNTARGDLVDEWALVEALREERLAGAALDVYEFEPTVLPDLRELPNAVLLPHLGSATLETRTAMADRACENLLAVLEGRAPRDRVA